MIHIEKFKNQLKRQQIFGAPSVEKKSSNRTKQRKQIGKEINNTTLQKEEDN